MESIQNNSTIVESYWELLQNLDAPVKLALIERLAQSLQTDASVTNSTANPLFATGNNTGTTTTENINHSNDEPYWWDALEE